MKESPEYSSIFIVMLSILACAVQMGAAYGLFTIPSATLA
jgi:hypothetical protein